MVSGQQTHSFCLKMGPYFFGCINNIMISKRLDRLGNGHILYISLLCMIFKQEWKANGII